jgi:molybdenum cofactor biosynthesis enzyme MoaA
MQQPRFCPKPFEFFDIHYLDGKLLAYVCCRQWLPHSIGDLTASSPDEVWNSETARELRRSMIDGSLKYCSEELCPEIQGGHLHDPRFMATARYRDYLQMTDGYSPKGPRTIFFSEDRSCNLSCPSCRTGTFVLPGDIASQIQDARGKFLDWLLKDARELGLSSGDPFASRIYRDFLFNLDGRRYPELKININTNGTLFDRATWEKMEKIHGNIHCVFVSLDAACRETYSQVRRGGNWDTLLNNLNFLSTLRKKGLIRFFRLDFVVQENNFQEMPAFVKLGRRVNADKVLFQRISNWGTFSAEEFKAKDVFRPSHPLHASFLEICRHPLLRSKTVQEGNLSAYIPPSNRRRAMELAKRFPLIREVRKRARILLEQVQK